MLSTRLTARLNLRRFTFDHVYNQDSSQEDVYNQSARQLVHSTLQVGGVARAPQQALRAYAGRGGPDGLMRLLARGKCVQEGQL